MSLVARLISHEVRGSKIPIHQFMAFLEEIGRGHAAAVDLVAAFGLDTAGLKELDFLVSNCQAKGYSSEYAREVHGVLLLAERGTRYGTEAEVKARLGI